MPTVVRSGSSSPSSLPPVVARRPTKLTSLERVRLGNRLLAVKKPGVVNAPGVPKLPSMSGKLLVVNKGVAPSWDAQRGDPKVTGNHSSLMTMDLKTGRMTRQVKLHDQAHEIAVSSDGRTAVIPHFVETVPGDDSQAGSAVTVLDLQGGAPKVVPLPGYTGAHGLAWLDRDHIAVTADSHQPHTEKSFLVELNVRTLKVTRAIPTGQDETHLVQLSPDKKTYLVTDLAGKFSTIDRASGKVKKTLRTGEGTEGFDITPDGREIWVAARGDDRITVLDARTLERKGRITSKGGPIRVLFTTDGKHALVTNRDANAIGVIETATRREVKRIDLMVPRLQSGKPQPRSPSGPMMIVLNDKAHTGFVASSHSGVVTAFDTKTWEVTGFLKAGMGPDPLALLP